MSQVKEQNHAEEQAKAQLKSIVEMVAAMNAAHEADDQDAFDEAREAVQEDPLSVQIRSGWYSPGEENPEAEEFNILLCTGGPAVRIVGDLGKYNAPENPRIQYQDWGTPWTEYFPNSEEREALQTYCEQFYFGD